MAKDTITIRIQSELIDRLDGEAKDKDVSRSEYIRQILRSRHESKDLREEIEDLRDRLDQREQRIDELEEQLTKRSQLEEKVENLPDQIREAEHEPSPPFIVRWVQWWRNRE
jgi:chromosome segregation ATPase